MHIVSQVKQNPSPKPFFFTYTHSLLIFARSWYVAGITNYYAFFTIEQYSMTIQQAQMFLFAFLIAGALGTFFGGPLADRFGKRISSPFLYLDLLHFPF